jgi:hypothetical protein
MNRNRLHMRFTSASVCWIAVCSACLFVGCGGGGAGGPGGGGDEPTDVQQAKNMVNFVRDVAASSRKLGLDATEVFEGILEAQQRIGRGVTEQTYLSSHVSHLFNVFVQLEGEPPGNYIYRAFSPTKGVLNRDFSSPPPPNGWSVQMLIQPVTVTLNISSETPLRRLVLTPLATRYTVQAIGQSLDYRGTLEITSNSGSRLIAFNLNITMRERQLTSEVTFRGQGSARLAADPTADGRAQVTQLRLNGRLQTPFGSCDVTNLGLTYDPDWNENNSLRQLTAESLILQEGANRAEIANLDVQLKKLPNGVLAVQAASANRLFVQAGSLRRVELSEVRSEWGDYPAGGANPTDTAIRQLSARMRMEARRGTYSGDVQVDWSNPQPLSNWDRLGGSLNTFPTGTIRFSGQFQAQNARPVLIEGLEARLEPTATPPSVRISGSFKRDQQTVSAQWESSLTEQGKLGPSSLVANYSPSDLRLAVTVSGSRVNGSIVRLPVEEKLADVGNARLLGLPDLGDTVVVRYRDNTFEALDSLWLGGE